MTKLDIISKKPVVSQFLVFYPVFLLLKTGFCIIHGFFNFKKPDIRSLPLPWSFPSDSVCLSPADLSHYYYTRFPPNHEKLVHVESP